MTTYIGLLRGVNLGGNRMVAMADLRDMVGRLGFANVKTLLQSGNVVFQGRAAAPATVERRLEAELKKCVGLDVEFHVRTAAEWRDVVAGNVFAAEAAKDPGRLLVSCFKTPLVKANVKALEAAIAAVGGPETLVADGRHLYMFFPDGVGQSKAAALIDRKLAARGTARNWNTVLKLAALTG